MCSKSPHVVRLDDALTDVGTVQFTTTMDYDNLNRGLQFWCKNQSQFYRSKDKVPEFSKGLYVNCSDFFYAEDFVGKIGIMLLNFRLLRSPHIY